jgi:hypothetical protein
MPDFSTGRGSGGFVGAPTIVRAGGGSSGHGFDGAPTVVRVVQILLILSMVGLAFGSVGIVIGVVLGFGATLTGHLWGLGIVAASVFGLVGLGVVFVLTALFYRLLASRSSIAWYIELILAGLAALGIVGSLGPHGGATLPSGIVHAVILYFWLKPETRAWFGVA